MQANGEQGRCTHDDNEHDRRVTTLSAVRTYGALVNEAETRNMHDHSQHDQGQSPPRLSLRVISISSSEPNAATAIVIETSSSESLSYRTAMAAERWNIGRKKWLI